MNTKHPEVMSGTGKPIGKNVPQPRQTPDAATSTPERQKAAESMKKVAKTVLQAMQPLIQNGQVRVTQSPRGVTVEINASVLFKSGEAVLQPQSTEALAAVARVLSSGGEPDSGGRAHRQHSHQQCPISRPTGSCLHRVPAASCGCSPSEVCRRRAWWPSAMPTIGRLIPMPRRMGAAATGG
jgi:hypothetical protein